MITAGIKHNFRKGQYIWSLMNSVCKYDPLDMDYSDYEHGQDMDIELIGPGHPEYERIKALFDKE
jgi:hypothetical protein